MIVCRDSIARRCRFLRMVTRVAELCFAVRMAWMWTFEDDNGDARQPEGVAPDQSFPTQSDAETWLGEVWRDLADAGIAAVSLAEDDRAVYGPMPLAAG